MTNKNAKREEKRREDIERRETKAKLRKTTQYFTFLNQYIIATNTMIIEIQIIDIKLIKKNLKLEIITSVTLSKCFILIKIQVKLVIIIVFIKLMKINFTNFVISAGLVSNEKKSVLSITLI